MEISKKGLVILIVTITLVSVAISWYIININNAPLPQQPPPNDIQRHAFDAVQAMGVGWNLGNALDSTDNRKRGIAGPLRDEIPAVLFYETYWHNPVTTFEMIESIAQKGFGAVRVPVTFNDHLDEYFNIRPEWLRRVRQVVNYVLDNNMYCIINIHHDTGSGSWPWLRADYDNIEWMEEKLAIVWTQIAEYFKDYSDRLIFESFNEILDAQSNWNNPSQASLTAVNRLNQVFVDTVRGTGGNNEERFLIVKTYASATYDNILEAFKLPEDSAESRLIVSVHFYGTHAFALQQDQVRWTETYSDWRHSRDGLHVENMFLRLKAAFVDRGTPVIIGEFGAQNKNNTTDRINYAVHFVETAKLYGIVCFWWDDGGKHENAREVRNFALFDRHRNEWFFPEIAEAIVNASRNADIEYE